jgi:bifunctional NMN adenylyltransferase/nudix hydrolase
MKKYNLCVLIGRFSPLHIEHEGMVKAAKKIANKVLIILGSPNVPLSLKHIFSFNERASIIQSVFPDVLIKSCPDYYADANWFSEIQNIIGSIEPNKDKVCVINSKKDNYNYSRLGVTIPYEFVKPEISATNLRNALFTGNLELVESMMSKRAFDSLKMINLSGKTDYFNQISEYQAKHGVGPFVTVHSVVKTKDGKTLTVVRHDEPIGAGLYSIPSSPIELNESTRHTAIRELIQKTNITLPEINGVRENIYMYSDSKEPKTFSNPNRSDRGHTISIVHYFELPYASTEISIKSSDSSSELAFTDCTTDKDLLRDKFFEDNLDIIHS